MKFKAQEFYHIYNRGNNKQPIFFSRQNYLFFLRKMRTHIKPSAKILAYCLMPNHFHWLLRTVDINTSEKNNHSLNLQVGTLLGSYANAINKRYNRTGSLFKQKTKAIHINSQNYALTCFHYIHQNPLKAGLVENMEDWSYSSYRDYIGRRNGTLIAKQFTLDILKISQHKVAAESKKAIDPLKIKKNILG